MKTLTVWTRRSATVVSLASAGAALGWANPFAGGVPGAHRSVTGWSARPTDSQLAALAGLVGWLLLSWLVVAALATTAGGLPGLAGAVGRLISRRIAPAAVRRVVQAAMGIAISAAVVAPTATLAAGPTAGRLAGGARATGVERSVGAGATGVERAPGRVPSAPSQLGDRVSSKAIAVDGAKATPGFDRPGLGGVETATAPPRPAASLAVVRGAHRAGDAPGDAAVVVRRGDSLWAIASRELGPTASEAAVDARWRRWYAANRSVIGADPDLISPGIRLVPPATNGLTPPAGVAE